MSEELDPLLQELEERPEDSMPPDIEEFMAECGIGKKTYTTSVVQWPTEGGGQPVYIMPPMKSKYPEIEEIGVQFGPGKYEYQFKWKEGTPTGRSRAQMKSMKVQLGPQWADRHAEYMFQQKQERLKRLERMRDDAEANKILFGNNKNTGDAASAGNPLEQLMETKNTLQNLGVPIGQNLPAAASESNNQMITLMMTSQQRMTELMMAMQQQNSTNMMQMMTAILTNNKPVGTEEKISDIMKVMVGMNDMKNILSPEKETLVDKIFGLMQVVTPQVVGLLKKSPAERQADPVFQLAQNSEEYRELKKDPSMVDALASKLDAHYGKEQTDNILTVMDLERSGVQGAPANVQTQNVASVPQPEEGQVTDVPPQTGGGEPVQGAMPDLSQYQDTEPDFDADDID